MKGYWTREPPEKAGWYKVIQISTPEDESQIEFVEIRLGFIENEELRVHITGQNESLHLEDFTWWWSKPETLPTLPDEEV